MLAAVTPSAIGSNPASGLLKKGQQNRSEPWPHHLAGAGQAGLLGLDLAHDFETVT
jgi:hypothetical protein